MFTLEELAALFNAMAENVVSVSSGIIGALLFLASIWVSDAQYKRIVRILGVVFLLLSPSYAWRDEHRMHNRNKQTWNDAKQKMEADHTKNLAIKDTELSQKDILIQELKDIRKYHGLTLRPNMTISFYYDDKGSGWRVFNSGLGPAVIKWFSVQVDNSYKASWREVWEAILATKKLEYAFVNLPPETHFRPGISNNLFWIGLGKDSENLRRQIDRVYMELCYCSLYGECWLTTNKRERPPKENSCESRPKVIF
jgi:hypothetical protein